MPSGAPLRLVATALLGAAAWSLFGAGDVARALLRPGSVLSGSALTSAVVLHAGFGLVLGLVLALVALPWRYAEAAPRAALAVGTPVVFVVLLANVHWLPAFLAPISLAVDVAAVVVIVLGVRFLAPRLGPPRPVRSGVVAAAVVAGAFALPLVERVSGGDDDGVVVTGTGGPAVVVVVVDTLRADALSAYGAEPGADPRLAELAENGVVFENVRTASTWTKPATASILTGLHPAVHGAVLHDQTLPRDAVTLAEILREAGYRTGAFSANPWVSPLFGFGQGFDRFEVRRPSVLLTGTLLGKAVSTLRLRFKNPVTAGLYEGFRACDTLLMPGGAGYEDEPSGSTLVERALAFVDGGRGRFFLYLHLMEPHAPYDPPAALRERFDPGGEGPMPTRAPAYTGMLPWDEAEALPAPEEARLRAAYRGEVAAADAALGELLDGLARRKVLHDTVFCVLADHGEEFHEHGAWGHGHSLHDEVSRVPWILRLPEKQHAGRRVKGAVSTVDVVPTLLGVLGLELVDPPRAPQGESLTAQIEGRERIPANRVVFSEVTTGPETLRLAATAERAVVTYEGRGDEGSVAWPGETPHAALLRTLEETFAAFARNALRAGRRAIEAEERSQFEGIGYLR